LLVAQQLMTTTLRPKGEAEAEGYGEAEAKGEAEAEGYGEAEAEAETAPPVNCPPGTTPQANGTCLQG